MNVPRRIAGRFFAEVISGAEQGQLKRLGLDALVLNAVTRFHEGGKLVEMDYEEFLLSQAVPPDGVVHFWCEGREYECPLETFRNGTAVPPGTYATDLQ